MKKLIGYLIVFLNVFCIYKEVYAQPYLLKEAIGVGVEATVEADSFTYSNFSYSNSLDSKGNGKINFSSITNKTNNKMPVSIGVALFDSNDKNIGYINYCSDKDFGGEYEDFFLNSLGSTSFYINVTSKYLIKDKSPADVRSIVVLDDNKYCKIGGSDKYQGLTIDEVVNGKVAADNSENKISLDVLFFLKGKGSMIIIGLVVFILIIYIIQGMILNALHKRMFASKTAMAYIPILNLYVSVKLSFGGLIGKIYLILWFVAFCLTFIGISIFSMFINAIGGISFVIVIIKLITKKYDLFYFEPTLRNDLNNSHSGSNIVDSNYNNSVNNSVMPEDNTVVDLNYGDMVDISLGGGSVNNNINTGMNDSDISIGGINSGLGNPNDNLVNNDLNNNLNNNFNDSLNNNLDFNSSNINNNGNGNGEESDLSKFFK